MSFTEKGGDFIEAYGGNQQIACILERTGKRRRSATGWPLWNLYNFETAELLDGVEVPVIVQKCNVVLDGSCSDHTVDYFVGRDATAPQSAIKSFIVASFGWGVLWPRRLR